MNRRLNTLIWLLVFALFVGVADEGLAGKKNGKKKKKKKKADASETVETEGSSSPSAPAPPKVVRDVDKKLVAYDTSAARNLLSGEAIDSNAYLKMADGRVLEQEGNSSQAIARLTSAAAEASKDPAPQIYLAEAQRRAKNTGAANDAFAKAEQRARAILDSDPKNTEALYYLGVAQQGLSKHNEAIATLQTARGTSPGDALIVYQLGVTQALQKNWSTAIDTLSEAINMNSGIAYAYYYRGLACGESGRKDLLVNDLERFLAMAPNAPEAAIAKRFLSGL